MRVLQSLMRGLNALDYLDAVGRPVRLTDLADYFSIDKSNASHMMRTLVLAGYAEQVEDRKYTLGQKLKMIKNESKNPSLIEVIDLRENMRETLKTLVKLSQECAHMAVRVGQKVWYVDKVSSPLPLKVDHPVGILSPLHCTALGKSFLAFGNIISTEKLVSYTPTTIIDKKKLETEIVATKNRRYAIDDEEFETGIRCVAAPVFSRGGEMVAAIGLSGPSARISIDRLDTLGMLVLKHCAKNN